jgi:hypothetical protein
MRFLLPVLFLFFVGHQLSAQDITRFDWKKPVNVTGGFSITNTFYQSEGMTARRDPWYWLLSGNANVQLFNVISMPVSAQWSQQNRSYTQPFNHFGLSPTYKAWTVMAGYRSVNYSTYSVGGNQWLGGGIEYKPSNGPLSVSVLYGRFQKGVNQFVTDGVISGTPAYERWVYAGKVAYSKNRRNVALQMLRGKDDASTMDDSTALKAGLKPGMNFVWAITSNQKLTKHLNWDIEYANSAYTEDDRTISSDVSKHKYLNGLGSFFTTNTSTHIDKAINTSLTFSQQLYQLKFSYRRVDPGYKTMGSIFLNNDIEDISGGVTLKLFQQKVVTNFTGGVQRNNLDKKLTQEAVRNAMSASVQWTVSKKVNLNMQYSNFLASTKFNNLNVTANQLNLLQNSDSLKYNQVTQNASANGVLQWGDSLVRNSITSTLSWQQANDNKGVSSQFYSANAGYTISWIPSKWALTASIMSTYNTVSDVKNQLFGPGMTLSKGIAKIWRFSYHFTYATNLVDGSSTGHTLNNRLSCQYKPSTHHTFSADAGWLYRKQNKIVVTNASEYRFNIVYGYVF